MIASHPACRSPIELPHQHRPDSKPDERERYHVILDETEVPVLDKFTPMARALDSNGDGIVSADEILDPETDLGPIQLDHADFTFSLKHSLTGLASPYASAYPSAAQVEAKLADLEQSYPDLAERVALGTSEEGRTIWALRVGRGQRDQKPGVMVVGGQHAREWAPNQAVTETAERLLAGFETDPEMTRRLNSLDLWFVPLANPDGYEFSRNANPDWRKNRSSLEGEKVGVDLNRNFRANYRFYGDAPDSSQDDVGASDDPTDLTFRGPYAHSENETQALSDLIDTRANLVGVFDVHAFGRLILFPKAESEEKQQVYQEIACAIQENLDVPYTPLAIPDLYPTTGDITAYAESRGLLSMGLELGTAFQPSPDKVDSLKQRGSEAILTFLDQALLRNS